MLNDRGLRADGLRMSGRAGVRGRRCEVPTGRGADHSLEFESGGLCWAEEIMLLAKEENREAGEVGSYDWASGGR